MVTEPRHPSRPQPHLAALGALAAAALFGWLAYSGLTTGELDFRQVHATRADDPALFWVIEAFLAALLLLSLVALALSVRAMLRPDPPARGPDWK
jgi:glycerol uptake facilitator-like aquaporin